MQFNNYLNQILEKVPIEQQQIFALGDFNINLLNYDVHHQPANDFLDSLASNCIIPYILQTTRDELLRNSHRQHF